MVEESGIGVQAGIAAGMMVPGYVGTESAEKLEQEGAIVFDSMAQLPMLLEKIVQNNEPDITIEPALLEDAGTILELQKLAYMQEAIFYNSYNIPPLTQTLEETIQEFKAQTVLKATLNGRIVGSARGYLEDGTCYVGKIMVNPDFQNRGLGSRLLYAVEQLFPEAQRYELFTGYKSQKNLHLYKKYGYKIFKTVPINDKVSLSFMEKAGPGAI